MMLEFIAAHGTIKNMNSSVKLVIAFLLGALTVLFFERAYNSKDRINEIAAQETQAPQSAGEKTVGESGSSSQRTSPQQPNMISARKVEVAEILAKMDQRRKDTVASILPSEMQAWKELREQKVADFLKATDVFWHNGSKEPQGRFDRNIIEASMGEYRGHLEYQAPNMREPIFFEMLLKITSTRPEVQSNIIQLASNGHGSFNSTFSLEYFGTDSKENVLNVVWYNFQANQTPIVSHFAFRLRPGISQGQAFSEELFGLDEHLQFQKIGSVSLKKTQ